jgi:DNA polymerase
VVPSPSANLATADLAALAWLVNAGVDVLVDDAPRNWLRAPVVPPAPPPFVAPPQRTPRVASAALPPAAAAARAAAEAAPDLAALAAAVAGFAHPLAAGTPPRLIEGATASGLIIIGDMPDAEGSPAALLQARMLAAIGLDAGRAATAHLLPWPTAGGRPPRDEDIASFAPFLARALTLAAPRLILALGDKAAALGGEARGVASLRGRWLAVGNVPMLATFHPRRLLSQPDLKKLAWADLQAFAARRESLA